MAPAAGGDVTQNDARIGFIRDHPRATRSAMDLGVDGRGFFYWSLLDNFEGTCGYGPRFGPVHVDDGGMARTPEASRHAFRRMLTGA